MIHLLVVDDELDIPVLFQQRFRKEIKSGEFNFNFVHSGSEALEYINKHNDEIELILSDINMPGMNGLELLRRVRQKHAKPKPVIIMITAYGDDKNYTTAMEYGADEFLIKPLDFEELKRKVSSHVH